MDLNDTIDDENTLCIPSLNNIQPYQFEPMADMSSNATKCQKSRIILMSMDADHEEKESRDIRLDNLAWKEMLSSTFTNLFPLHIRSKLFSLCNLTKCKNKS